ncbi:hypothetical protein GEMRC1_005335 [Eukaryota sp. GEM-RC1]
MTCPEPLLKRSRPSPSSISSVMSNCDELSVLSSSTYAPSKRVHVQQSLLILIHLHLLRRLLKHAKIPLRTDHQLPALQTALPTFFEQVGYVSNHFLDSSFQAVKVFFPVHTFHANLKHLPKLISVASFFGADLQSVFLHTDATLQIENFFNYSGNPPDLEFVNNSSSLFPRLKQLEVDVFQNESFSLLFIETLKVNASVTTVNLVGNYIGAEGARALAEALKVNASVTSIDLEFNSIGAEGARALAEALKVNASLTIIDLSNNSIGAKGARDLAEALKVNGSVTSVNLWNNSVGDEGARVMADVLKVNTSVTNIDLSYNSIGDEGVKALAEALKVNTSVTSVNLKCNSIGDDGARALAEALKVNPSVTSVNLGYNSIGDDGARALSEALKVNPRLKIEGVVGLNES